MDNLTKEIDINIPIKRTGFPIKIGKIELWFDSSAENLRKFLNVDEIAKERLKIAQDKAEHIHFPEEVTEDNVQDIDDKTLDDALNLKNEFVAIQYDVVFGDGTFKKIYKEYPDVFALEEALDPINYAIAETITKQEEARATDVKKKESEYLKNKQQKKK